MTAANIQLAYDMHEIASIQGHCLTKIFCPSNTKTTHFADIEKEFVKDMMIIDDTCSTSSVTGYTPKTGKLFRRTSRPTIQLLGSNYKPTPYDVLCIRGKRAFNHTGNKYLRQLIEERKKKYGDATSRHQRIAVVSTIVNAVRAKGNGFVKQGDNGQWYEIGDYQSREKVSYLLRNANSSIYRSSAKAKKARRKDKAPKLLDDFSKVLRSNPQVSHVLDMIQNHMHMGALSDKEVMDLFNHANSCLLTSFKGDLTLMAQFNAIDSVLEDCDSTITHSTDKVAWEWDDEALSFTDNCMFEEYHVDKYCYRLY